MRVTDALDLDHQGAPSAPVATRTLLYAKSDGKLYTHSDDGKVTPQASESYVQSRGMNLVANGSGLLGSNFNFTGATFNPVDRPPGALGSFEFPSSSGMTTNDENIPVDPSKTYRFQFATKQLAAGVLCHTYGMIQPRDVDGNTILPYDYAYVAGTTTQLAAPLNPGDTTVTLVSSANWHNGATTSRKYITFWDYVDGKGYAWPKQTYSRNHVGDDLWASGAIVGNVITLRAPYAGPAKPAGLWVSNGMAGSSYIYLGLTNGPVPTEWTSYSEEVGRIVYDGSVAGNVPKTFPPGTAFIQVGWLRNRNPAGGGGDVAGSRQAVANISLTEITAANLTDGSVAGTKLTDATVGIEKLSATGTKSTNTYLRGDNTWFTLSNPSQAEAEAGTATSLRLWTAQRVNQAIQALAAVKSVAGRTGAVILGKADVGLSNVDNTSDASKPVSTAQQAALDGKVATTDPRLSDARTPTAHTHPVSAVDNLQALLDGKVGTSDPRLSDARTPLTHGHTADEVEPTVSRLWVPGGGSDNQVLKKVGGVPTWAADADTDTTYAVPSQAEAEAGTATNARAFSAERVKQAIQALAPVKTLGNLRVDGTGKVSVTDQLYKDGETWHKIGAAGEPAFMNGWQNYNQFNEVYFRKDSSGVVHIVGRVFKPTAVTGESDVFTLPEGYRPTMSPKDFLTPSASTTQTMRGRVQTNGSLSIFDPFANGWVSVAMSVPAM